MGKQRIFRRTGFLEKHTNSEGKNPKYEIQEEILYQFLTLLIDGVNYNSSIKKLSSHRKRADTHMNPTIVGEIRKNIVE